MHFSRNPPGPNPSCIEGFADSAVGLLAAPAATVGSSSRRTYSRWAVLAVRLSFVTGGSPAELDTCFARNPPSFPSWRTWGPVTIAYPFLLLRLRTPYAAAHCILLDSGHLRVEHATSFCAAARHSRRVTFGSGIVSVFLSRGERKSICRGGHMNRIKTLPFLPVLLLAALSLAACSGPKNRCTVNCGGGTATVNLTLVSDTPPASPSLLSYKVTVTQVTVTPTTGTAFTFTPNPAPVFELLHLQSEDRSRVWRKSKGRAGRRSDRNLRDGNLVGEQRRAGRRSIRDQSQVHRGRSAAAVDGAAILRAATGS